MRPLLDHPYQAALQWALSTGMVLFRVFSRVWNVMGPPERKAMQACLVSRYHFPVPIGFTIGNLIDRWNK